MKIITKIAIVLIVLFVLFAIIGLFLPSTSQVERTTVINAPVAKVFDLVNDLEKKKQWYPWAEKDDKIEISMGKITQGKGATYSWKSENSGNGTLTIIESINNKSLKTSFGFKEQGEGTRYWSFTETKEGVKVLQGFKTDMGFNIPGRYFRPLIESKIGEFFDLGLKKLKEAAEKE